MRILGDSISAARPAGTAGSSGRVCDAGPGGQARWAPTPRPGDLATVLRGLPHNVTTEMDLDLWRLATRIRADADAANVIRRIPAAELAGRYRTQTLPPVVQRGLEEFLDRYGHRAVAEIDVGLPRWAEDPTHIIGVLANYLRLEDPARAPDLLFARGAARSRGDGHHPHRARPSTRPGAGPGRGLRAEPGTATRRSTRTPQVLHRARPRPGPPAAGGRGRAIGRDG